MRCLLATSGFRKPTPLLLFRFDIDGTLMHSDGLHLQVFQAFFLQHGYGGGVPITEVGYYYYSHSVASAHGLSGFFQNQDKRA